MEINKSLSKSAQLIQSALRERGMDQQVVELSKSTRTAQDAATSLGCTVAQIVKSLIFRSEVSHQPILILASGMNRVNEKAIEDLIGEKITKADADFTREKTGFAIGGVPPVGHAQPIQQIFIDEDLLQYEQLWAAAGTPNAVFPLQSRELQELTKGKVISIK